MALPWPPPPLRPHFGGPVALQVTKKCSQYFGEDFNVRESFLIRGKCSCAQDVVPNGKYKKRRIRKEISNNISWSHLEVTLSNHGWGVNEGAKWTPTFLIRKFPTYFWDARARERDWRTNTYPFPEKVHWEMQFCYAKKASKLWGKKTPLRW